MARDDGSVDGGPRWTQYIGAIMFIAGMLVLTWFVMEVLL